MGVQRADFSIGSTETAQPLFSRQAIAVLEIVQVSAVSAHADRGPELIKFGTGSSSASWAFEPVRYRLLGGGAQIGLPLPIFDVWYIEPPIRQISVVLEGQIARTTDEIAPADLAMVGIAQRRKWAIVRLAVLLLLLLLCHRDVEWGTNMMMMMMQDDE